MPLPLMLLAVLTSEVQAPTSESGTITLRRLRSVDAAIQTTIEEGCRRSPIFAELVNDIERSNFVVYVEEVPSLRNGMKGALLHTTSEARYLRIHVKRDLTSDQRIAVLAHELQHVREVVQSGIDADAAALEMLFRRIGGKRLSSGRRQQFETAAAVRVGDAVAAELRSPRQVPPRALACR